MRVLRLTAFRAAFRVLCIGVLFELGSEGAVHTRTSLGVVTVGIIMFSIYCFPGDYGWDWFSEYSDVGTNWDWERWMQPEYREHAMDAVRDGHQGNPDFDRSFLGSALRDWQRNVIEWRRNAPKRLALAMAFHPNLGGDSPLGVCPVEIVRREIIPHM